MCSCSPQPAGLEPLSEAVLHLLLSVGGHRTQVFAVHVLVVSRLVPPLGFSGLLLILRLSGFGGAEQPRREYWKHLFHSYCQTFME